MSKLLTMTNEELEQLIQKKLAEQAALMKAEHAKPFGLKVSDKGAVSVYGIGRFPVTLYGSQWERLLVEEKDKILSFLKANADKLAVKGAVKA